ncbi:uncharacterized protein G2W53_003955 [Senna tora]|uniref:Uncharacterized protein n=1 Tax=Senna tora TaxID=362788 RepID=A0A834XC03_9FABA|nr:uncharacterized protein G2W53_003955 [Senna tora]
MEEKEWFRFGGEERKETERRRQKGEEDEGGYGLDWGKVWRGSRFGDRRVEALGRCWRCGGGSVLVAMEVWKLLDYGVIVIVPMPVATTFTPTVAVSTPIEVGARWGFCAM